MPAAEITRPTPAPARRLGRLVGLCDARLSGLFGPKVARIAAILIGIVAALAMPFVARGSKGDFSPSLVPSALTWLSWLCAGIVAFTAAGIGDSDDDQALVALARARGFAPSRMAFARALAVARRIRRLVGIPALLLALESLGFSRSLSVLGARVLLVLTVALYVFVLSALLAILVHLARSLGRERPRAMFFALVFVPYVLRAVVPNFPSAPSILGFMLDHLIVPGAAA